MCALSPIDLSGDPSDGTTAAPTSFVVTAWEACMKVSRLCVSALFGISILGRIVFTTGEAHAQESVLVETKERSRKAPASSDASLTYGRALRSAGREGDALTELRRGQAYAKGDARVSFAWEIARTHIAKRDFGAAKRACMSIAKLPKGEAASHVCMGEAHLLWRRGIEALDAVGNVGELSNFSEEIQYYARLVEGRSYELDSRDEHAETAYREAIRIAPNRADAHVLLGALLHRVGKDGLPSLRRATEIDPRDPTALFELGRVLALDSKTRGKAIETFEKAVAERPTFVEALRALTETYVASDRLTDARRVARSVLKLAPNDVLAHVVSGQVALAEGQLDVALEEGKTALALMPNEGKAKLLIADAYAKKGEIDLALEAYQSASGLSPLDPTPLVNATNACIAAGRVTSAKAFAKRAALDFPNHAVSWIAKGDALAADGDRAAARTSYERAKTLPSADRALIEKRLSSLR